MSKRSPQKSSQSPPAQTSPQATGTGKRETVHASRWTFLTNHAHVLILLHANPELVLREVATQVGITERAVQRIIQDLVDEAFVERERVGRKNRYRVLKEQPLRHPIEAHRKIGDLLQLISGDPARLSRAGDRRK